MSFQILFNFRFHQSGLLKWDFKNSFWTASGVKHDRGGYGLSVLVFLSPFCGNQRAVPEDSSFSCCCYYVCFQCGPNWKGMSLELTIHSSSSFLIVLFLESTVQLKYSGFPTFLIEVDSLLEFWFFIDRFVIIPKNPPSINCKHSVFHIEAL